MQNVDATAKAALRERLGKGARYDAPAAPAEDLLMARRATAFFARKLMELPDAALAEPTMIVGWSRAHVVADVGYDARNQAFALEALARGVPYVPPTHEADQLPTLDLAVTLPARALRHLFQHSEIHLSVCWRDLMNAHWHMAVTHPHGQALPVRSLPRLRARMLWRAALDLHAGGGLECLPAEGRAALASAVVR